ncbi:AraC family transcriptional regulator [Pseudescherichia vulneris]|uniref:Putative AraC family transcriptional regulator n=1 Tax=Pseudescherichia vulneris NBRC 102420 TaxID=1115515 RepID=A0A090V8T9_PSEVU|nr:helix-turn-helix domain-containing protein [Pseudescherichia vulneris]GAL59699.1 putative AraC family transcriptional regulator [Pseudescherichia vulneris NBRC 102420]STQ56717.1 AraC family transcriptional regulator [Pseudescherichia vulneris]HBC82283.1 AraC family transcriptional regulator [Escherichia sp.]
MLELSIALPVKVQNGGLFISRGVGRHPSRRLDSWEIIFVEKGTLAIREEEMLFQVNAGESLLLWPRRRHVGVDDFPADLKFYWLHFEVEAEVGRSPWVSMLSIPQHMRIRDPQYMISLFRQFLSEQEKLERTAALEFILLMILQQMTPGEQIREESNDSGAALAWKAQQLIRTRFHLPLSTSMLARELHCNADYLGRIYRRVFHLTLTEAIHRQRVRAAEKLLISDARSLREVAGLCGFSDVGYFRQIFRKHTGLTPAIWKRRYCKEHINS